MNNAGRDSKIEPMADTLHKNIWELNVGDVIKGSSDASWPASDIDVVTDVSSRNGYWKLVLASGATMAATPRDFPTFTVVAGYPKPITTMPVEEGELIALFDFAE